MRRRGRSIYPGKKESFPKKEKSAERLISFFRSFPQKDEPGHLYQLTNILRRF